MVTTPRENKFSVAKDQKLSLQIPMNHTQVHWNSYIILRNMNTILRNVMSMTIYLTIPFLPPSLLKNHFIYNHIVEMKKNSYWCHTFSFLSPIYNNLCCPFLTNKWALSLLGYFICACKTLNVGTGEQKLWEAECWSLIQQMSKWYLEKVSKKLWSNTKEGMHAWRKVGLLSFSGSRNYGCE